MSELYCREQWIFWNKMHIFFPISWNMFFSAVCVVPFIRDFLKCMDHCPWIIEKVMQNMDVVMVRIMDSWSWGVKLGNTNNASSKYHLNHDCEVTHVLSQKTPGRLGSWQEVHLRSPWIEPTSSIGTSRKFCPLATLAGPWIVWECLKIITHLFTWVIFPLSIEVHLNYSD